jgi:hypothetical protein
VKNEGRNNKFAVKIRKISHEEKNPGDLDKKSSSGRLLVGSIDM